MGLVVARMVTRRRPFAVELVEARPRGRHVHRHDRALGRIHEELERALAEQRQRDLVDDRHAELPAVGADHPHLDDAGRDPPERVGASLVADHDAAIAGDHAKIAGTGGFVFGHRD
jgi:hypothetical protein